MHRRDLLVAILAPLTLLFHITHCLLAMGQMRWRIQEFLFLEQLAASPEGQEYLEGNKDDWWKHATNWFVDRYRTHFPMEPFSPETPDEFAQRRKLQPRGQLTMHPAETQQAMDKRFTNLPSVKHLRTQRRPGRC